MYSHLESHLAERVLDFITHQALAATLPPGDGEDSEDTAKPKHRPSPVARPWQETLNKLNLPDGMQGTYETQHRVSSGILVATLSFTYPAVEYPSLKHKYWYNIRGNIPRTGQGLEIMLMKDGQPATFHSVVLDVEGWKKLLPEDKQEGFRAVQRPRKLILTIPAINSIKALGHTAGQDMWRNLLTVPTARAHASLGVPLPNAPLNQCPG